MTNSEKIKKIIKDAHCFEDLMIGYKTAAKYCHNLGNTTNYKTFDETEIYKTIKFFTIDGCDDDILMVINDTGGSGADAIPECIVAFLKEVPKLPNIDFAISKVLLNSAVWHKRYKKVLS